MSRALTRALLAGALLLGGCTREAAPPEAAVADAAPPDTAPPETAPPAGTHVVVRAGATLYRDPARSMPAFTLGDAPAAFARVEATPTAVALRTGRAEPPLRHCAPGPDPLDDVALTVYAAPDALLPVTTAPLVHPIADGITLHVAPGAPVIDGRVTLPGYAFAPAAAPTTATAYTPAAAAESEGEGVVVRAGLLRPHGLGLGRETGVMSADGKLRSIRHFEGGRIADDHFEATTGCATVRVVTADPAAEAQVFRPLRGLLGGAAHREGAAGDPVYWPGGERAGALLRPIPRRRAEAEPGTGRTCRPFAPPPDPFASPFARARGDGPPPAMTPVRLCLDAAPAPAQK